MAVNADSTGNPHLILFQNLSQSLRDKPTEVIAQLSAWICDSSSPKLWAPFAFSVRGLAYELMDEWDLARLDYTRGLRLYDGLEQEQGSQAVKRMQTNVAFMKFRLQMLPPRTFLSVMTHVS